MHLHVFHGSSEHTAASCTHTEWGSVCDGDDDANLLGLKEIVHMEWFIPDDGNCSINDSCYCGKYMW